MATTNSANNLSISENSSFHVGNSCSHYNVVFEQQETPPEPCFDVPFNRDVDFVKRKKLLRQISQAFQQPSRVALVGLGGVGKSQLAIEHVYRVRDTCQQQNKKMWVFWIHAGTRERVEEGFKAVADAAKIPGRNQPGQDIFPLVYRWFRDERNDPWFMVLDGVDERSVFDNTDEHGNLTTPHPDRRALGQYIPQSLHGSILLTTRDRALAGWFTNGMGTTIDVGQMEPAQAFKLLVQKLGRINDDDQQAASDLIDGLDCIPLAIIQAAAYIRSRQPRLIVSKYLQECQKNEEEKWALLELNPADNRREASEWRSVMTTWHMSFNHILKQAESATNLLSLMSYFHPQNIPEFLVRYQADNSYNQVVMNRQFEDDIVTLRSYCLIDMNEEGNIFEMHELVQASTQIWLINNKRYERFDADYIKRTAQVLFGNKENEELCQRLFPHVKRAMLYCPRDATVNQNLALLLREGSWYALGRGMCGMAERMTTRSYGIRRELLGPTHPFTIGSQSIMESSRWNN